MKVKINVDNLVLDGFTKNEAAGFVQQFEQELSRLVRENGISMTSSNEGTFNLDTVRLAGNANSSLGLEVARLTYRSIHNNAR